MFEKSLFVGQVAILTKSHLFDNNISAYALSSQ